MDGEDRSPYGKPDAKILRSSNHSARGAIPRRSMRLISKVIFFLILSSLDLQLIVALVTTVNVSHPYFFIGKLRMHTLQPIIMREEVPIKL